MAVSGCWRDILGLTWRREVVVKMTCLFLFFFSGRGRDGMSRALAVEDMAGKLCPLI